MQTIQDTEMNIRGVCLLTDNAVLLNAGRLYLRTNSPDPDNNSSVSKNSFSRISSENNIMFLFVFSVSNHVELPLHSVTLSQIFYSSLSV